MKNVYAYVGGNPIASRDPRGLATQAQINAAVQVLRNASPEVYPNAPNSVTGQAGLTGWRFNPIAAATDLSGNITYNADLYGANGVPVPDAQLGDFFQTIAHEMQHMQEDPFDRIGISVGEFLGLFNPDWSIENQIDHNADLYYFQYYKEYLRRLHCAGKAQ